MRSSYHDCDLAMGGNERGGCESEEEDFSEHIGGGGNK